MRAKQARSIQKQPETAFTLYQTSIAALRSNMPVLGGMLLAPAIKTHCARFSQPATKGLLIAVFRQHRCCCCRCCCWDWPEWCRYTPYHPAVWPYTCILAPGFWRCHSSADSTSSQRTIAGLRPGPEQKAQAMSHRPNSPVAQVKRANQSRQHLYPVTWTPQLFGWVFYFLLLRTGSFNTHPGPD